MPNRLLQGADCYVGEVDFSETEEDLEVYM